MTTDIRDLEQIIDAETGELLDDVVIDDETLIALLVHRRHDAKAQEDGWKRQRVMLDAMILRRMTGKTVVDDILASPRSSTFTQTDCGAFVEGLVADEISRQDLLGVIHAASGFRTPEIPGEARPAYEAATQIRQKAQWLETKTVLRQAPHA